MIRTFFCFMLIWSFAAHAGDDIILKKVPENVEIIITHPYPYPYTRMLAVNGFAFVALYGMFRLMTTGFEKLTRSNGLSFNEKKYPHAAAWIQQEMAKYGFKSGDYILKANDTLHHWEISPYAEKPYVIVVPIQTAIEIEEMLTHGCIEDLLDQHRCAIYITCSQLSHNLPVIESDNLDSLIAWASAWCASAITSIAFFSDRANISDVNHWHDALHIAIPCFTAYKMFTSVSREFAIQSEFISKAIATLPDHLVSACIKYFENIKACELGTSRYDGYIQQLKERLEK